jgi:hypothetical protein
MRSIGRVSGEAVPAFSDANRHADRRVSAAVGSGTV